jgi:hypothetical protein
MRKPYKIALLVAICVAVVYWSKRGYEYYQNIPIGAKPSSDQSINIPDVPFYFQDDENWRNDKLGGRYESLGSSGCTVCCLSMAISSIGMKVNPKELNEYITKGNGYDGKGNIIWANVPLTNDVIIKVQKPSHEEIIASIKIGRPVLTKVKILEGFVHWVLIIGIDKGRYRIHDPLSSAAKTKYLDEITDHIDGIRVIK